jgi:hypothetical protein
MLVSVRFDIVLFMTQDMCTVCVEDTIGLKLFSTHPIEHLGDVGHVESQFGLLDIVVVSGQDWWVCAKK